MHYIYCMHTPSCPLPSASHRYRALPLVLRTDRRGMVGAPALHHHITIIIITLTSAINSNYKMRPTSNASLYF